MKYINTTCAQDPDLVAKFLKVVEELYRTIPGGDGYTAPTPKPAERYILAVNEENGDVAGGLRLDLANKKNQQLLHFQKKEVFNTLQRNLPFLNFDEMQLADVSLVAVNNKYQKRGIGTEVMSYAFTESEKMGSAMTFLSSELKKNNEPVYYKAAEKANFPAFPIAEVDLITSKWSWGRNTRRIIAVVHDKEAAKKIALYKEGILPWSPKTENTTVYASPYGGNRSIDAVILDWDNMMVDDSALWVAAISKTLRELQAQGHEIPSNVRVAHSQHPKKYLIGVLGEELAEEAYPILMKHYEELTPEVPSLKPGALETVRMLKENNIPFAIVSNAPGENVKHQIKHYLGKEFADVPVFGNAEKPSPKAILEALEALGCRPSPRVYMVGDAGTDVRAALNAGIHPILFSHGEVEIVNELSREDRAEIVGMVKDHHELQDFFRAQLRYSRRSGGELAR